MLVHAISECPTSYIGVVITIARDIILISVKYLYFHRRKALHMSMAGVRVEIRAVGRAHPPLPQAHRRETVQVCRLRALLRPLRPPRPAHETASA